MPQKQIILPQEEWDRLLEILGMQPVDSDADVIGQHIAGQLSVWPEPIQK